MKLRSAVGVAVALSVAVSLSGIAFAKGEAPAKSETVKGEVVDLACYLGHGAKGEAHKQCAASCLKGGQPAGLVTASGEVYLLAADHKDGKPFDQAKEHVADMVEIKGPVSKKGGISLLTVQSVSVAK